MPDLDDEKFELYLKQFRPVPPEPIPRNAVMRELRRRWMPAVWAMGAAAAMIVGVLVFHSFSHRGSGQSEPHGLVNVVPDRPLTIRNADALLAAAPSYKPVMDELAFPRQTIIPHGQESALAVLRKEKIKL